MAESIICYSIVLLVVSFVTVLLRNQKTAHAIARVLLFVFVCYFVYFTMQTVNVGDNFEIVNNTPTLIAEKYPDFPMNIEMPKSETIELTVPDELKVSASESLLLSKIKSLIEFLSSEVGIVAIIVFVFSVLIALFLSINIYKHYVLYLRNNLFSERYYRHYWMGQNSLDDILISIDTRKSNDSQNYDLLQFFKDRLFQKEQGIYAILGLPGEGKTVSTMKIAMMLVQLYLEKDRLMPFRKIGRNILGAITKLSRNKINFKLQAKAADSELSKSKLIPILLSYYDLRNAAQPGDLVSIAMSRIKKHYKGKGFWLGLDKIKHKLDKNFTAKLIRGRFVLIIDGYDEVNESIRYNISNLLKQFSTEYSKCNIIIAGRTNVFMEDRFIPIDPDKMLFLSPLTKNKIFEFISKWHFSEGHSGNELYYSVSDHFFLESLASNPLLLTMMCHLYENNALVNSNSVTKFYSETINLLLKDWEKEKGIPTRFAGKLQTKKDLLAHLAYDLFSDSKRVLKWEELYDDISTQSGLIENKDDSQYIFPHRSIYDFFVAQYFGKEQLSIDPLLDDINKNREILIFYFSSCATVEQTTTFLLRDKKHLIQFEQLLLEVNITNKTLIKSYCHEKLSSINKYDTKAFQILGYIAKKYEHVQETLYVYLLNELSQTNDRMYINNIIISLMIFREKEELLTLIEKNIKKIDIKELSSRTDSGSIELIIRLFSIVETAKYKIDIIEGLVSSFRLDSLSKLFINSRGELNRGIVALGFLYLTKHEQSFSWISECHLLDYASQSELDDVNAFVKKYNSQMLPVSVNMQKNILYLVRNVIPIIGSNNIEIQTELISNKICFLITMMKNENESTVLPHLVSINNFKFDTLQELKYHWCKVTNLRGLSKNPNIYKILAWGLMLLTFSLCTVYYMYFLYSQIDINNHNYLLVQELNNWYNTIADHYLNLDFTRTLFQMTSKNSAYISIGNTFHFDSRFLLFQVLWFFFLTQINRTQFYVKLDPLDVLFYFANHCCFFFVFCFFISNRIFRAIILVYLLISVLLNILKHKNNHPLYKEPLFSSVRSYLLHD